MNRKKYFYDKFPATKLNNEMLWEGWEGILNKISPHNSQIISIDCYTGIYYEELSSKFKKIPHILFVDTQKLFKTESEIRQMSDIFIQDDPLFGYMTNLTIQDYFDKDKVTNAQKEIAATKEKGNIILFGHGSSKIAKADTLIYLDMPRWEIQQRMRRNMIQGLGVNDSNEGFSIQYKRGYFNDWRILDKHKKTLYSQVDYWIDTTKPEPKLITQDTFFKGIEETIKKPFRVVPFFDPAPWGGQWMKEVCDLDQSEINYGWCFDCVPDENSLLFDIGGKVFEMPSVNLVYIKSKELLGNSVQSRFGDSFPIRFDLLDTMEGGNLSLQVHPTTQYLIDNFGLPYTQDESYYIVDAKDDGVVYLGLKPEIDPSAMINDLKCANKDPKLTFDEQKYVNIFPAKKHDHFLIPAGTIHCSGKNTVVLEISSTPNLFTFKLWDWNRLGLDGKPRPINIERGEEVIQWDRDLTYVNEQLVNQFEIINSNNGCYEEKTGLHKTQFIETRRHIFTKKTKHKTNGSVNVLCLVEGNEVIVESPSNKFEPFIVHYAETFIVPAAVKEYTIRPHGDSVNQKCVTIKAFVRF